MEILLGIVAVVILLGCVATLIALIGVFMTVVMRVVGLPRLGRGAWSVSGSTGSCRPTTSSVTRS